MTQHKAGWLGWVVTTVAMPSLPGMHISHKHALDDDDAQAPLWRDILSLLVRQSVLLLENQSGIQVVVAFWGPG